MTSRNDKRNGAAGGREILQKRCKLHGRTAGFSWLVNAVGCSSVPCSGIHADSNQHDDENNRQNSVYCDLTTLCSLCVVHASSLTKLVETVLVCYTCMETHEAVSSSEEFSNYHPTCQWAFILAEDE